MAFLEAKSSQYKGTKITGPQPTLPIVQATITAVNDLGLVKVNPAYPRKDGKTEVPQLEVIFTTPAGEQAKREYAPSLYYNPATGIEAGFRKLIVAATGADPRDTYELAELQAALIGRNVQLVGVSKKSAKGTQYYKVTSVVPAAPGQVTATAPKAQTAVAITTQTPGW